MYSPQPPCCPSRDSRSSKWPLGADAVASLEPAVAAEVVSFDGDMIRFSHLLLASPLPMQPSILFGGGRSTAGSPRS